MITLASDAHVAQNVGKDFDAVCRRLKLLGLIRLIYTGIAALLPTYYDRVITVLLPYLTKWICKISSLKV